MKLVLFLIALTILGANADPPVIAARSKSRKKSPGSKSKGSTSKSKGRKSKKKCPYNNIVDGKCRTPTEIADMAVTAVFVDFDAEAASKLLDENYIQHNPTVPTGSAPLLGFIPALEASGLSIEIHRTLESGNLVAYHATYRNANLFGGDTLVGFDVYRVEDGLVKEHWDNLQELIGPNPSGNTMTDGATEVINKGKRQTKKNRKRVIDGVETIMIGRDLDALTDFLNEDFIQHNPIVANGIDGLLAALEEFAGLYEIVEFNSIELIVAEGNFVLVGILGSVAGIPTAFYFLFRVEKGLLVESWDLTQIIPPPEEFAHDNGKF